MIVTINTPFQTDLELFMLNSQITPWTRSLFREGSVSESVWLCSEKGRASGVNDTCFQKVDPDCGALTVRLVSHQMSAHKKQWNNMKLDNSLLNRLTPAEKSSFVTEQGFKYAVRRGSCHAAVMSVVVVKCTLEWRMMLGTHHREAQLAQNGRPTSDHANITSAIL